MPLFSGMEKLRFCRVDGAVAATMLVAAIYWFSCYRYGGIWRDAIIYTLLAAHRLAPMAYDKDLFFIFGSQDSYSLYTPLFAQLVDWLGVDIANQTVVLAGGMLWILALVWLARGMFGDSPPFYMAVLACVVFRFSYEPNFATFTLNENFATARVIAIPLGVMAIASANADQHWRTAFLSLFATILHPLLGIWAVLLAISTRLPDKLLVLGIVVVGLALLFGATMTNMPSFQLMDPAWIEDVRHTSPEVFVEYWGTFNLDRFLFWMAALWLGGHAGSPRFRRLYLVAALLVAWAVFLSQLCSYWFPVRLVMQIQPWRALWIAVVLGVFALADASWRLVSTNQKKNGLWLLFATVVLESFKEVSGALLVVMVAGVTFYVYRPVRDSIDGLLARHRLLTLFVVTVAALIVLPTYWLMVTMDGLMLTASELDLAPALQGFVFGGGGLIFIFWAWLLNRSWGRKGVFLIGIPCLIYVISVWDMRSPALKKMEANYVVGKNAKHVFLNHIRSGDVVAWADHPLQIWFQLGTAAYSNSEQASGIVFSGSQGCWT